jgi:hypothetical protein
MERKEYLKPDAKYVIFYSDEEITAKISLEEGMRHEQQSKNGMGGEIISGSIGSGDGDDSWID